MPRPIVLDTDIGTDIDDVYALILAAASPELDLRAVVTVNNDVTLRARIARRVLSLLGRDDVPVAEGEGASLTPGESRGWGGHEGRGIELDEARTVDDLTCHGGIEVLEQHACRAVAEGCLLTLVTIGAMTNAARAVSELPTDSIAGIGSVVAMASSFEGFGPANARPEHNVACDPRAMAIVLESGLPLTLVGLNVTKLTKMDRAFVDRLAAIGSEAARAVTGMHYEWFSFIGGSSSPMHDGLALAALLDPSILDFVEAHAEMDLPGIPHGAVAYSHPTPEKPSNCRIAVSVDADAYHTLLHERVIHALIRDT